MKRRTALLGAAAGLVVAAVPDWGFKTKDQTVGIVGTLRAYENAVQHFDIFENPGMLRWHHQYDPVTRKGALLLPINNGYPRGEPDLPEDVEIDIEPFLTRGFIVDVRQKGWVPPVGQPYDADVNKMHLLVYANFFENFRGFESGLLSGIGGIITRRDRREDDKITNLTIREVILFPSEYQK